MKRIFDILFSLVALSFLLVPGIIVAILIVADSGFPVFFRQVRMGKGGKEFRLFKFRSMRTVAGAEKGSFDAGNSSRVTKIGHIIRKTKIDELPQFINVLKGDMSIVGPRPEVKKWTKVYTDRWHKVLSVKPGITDNASLLFRNEEEILASSANPEATYQNDILPKKLDLYCDYIDNQTFIGDLSIIVRTALAVVKL